MRKSRVNFDKFAFTIVDNIFGISSVADNYFGLLYTTQNQATLDLALVIGLRQIGSVGSKTGKLGQI